MFKLPRGDLQRRWCFQLQQVSSGYVFLGGRGVLLAVRLPLCVPRRCHRRNIVHSHTKRHPEQHPVAVAILHGVLCDAFQHRHRIAYALFYGLRYTLAIHFAKKLSRMHDREQ